MNLERKHVYFIPGLAAGKKIFKFINLAKINVEIHYLEWLLPLSNHESLENYAKRMSEKIEHKNAILIGVSFGGIVAQEISKIKKVDRVILISSVKDHKEFPNRLKFLNLTKIYKLIPYKLISETQSFENFKILKKKGKLYDTYFEVRNQDYLKWAIEQTLNWKQRKVSKNVIHIHGNKDHIFPIKHIKNCEIIDKGTHDMILTKSKKINKILEEIIT